MPIHYRVTSIFSLLFLLAGIAAAEDWTQLKYDGRHSGDVPQRELRLPLGLAGAAPLTDAVFTAPGGRRRRVDVVDGSGVALLSRCGDAARALEGGNSRWSEECNNVSSPALAGGYLDFGTMAGAAPCPRRG